MPDASRDIDPPRRTVRLAEYRPAEFAIETVDLVFELGEEKASVKSRLTIRRNPASTERSGALRLDGEALKLVSVALDGETLGANRYQLDDEALVLPDVPDLFTLDIETSIEPQNNTELSGLFKSGGSFCTQCEPEGFRRITFFQDRPDVMARFTTTMVADKARYPVLLSNGNPVDRGESAGGRHWAKWDDPHPKPAYLFALVAGEFAVVRDSFTTRSGRDVALGIWVRPGDEDKCAHAMASLKAAMKWDEDVFGLEYDLDVFNIVAVSDFNGGAMENKGLNIFNAKYVLARPDTATDGDYQGIESVIGHEYFHNWTGDRVTCRDWFQLSLKEGLTVFRDQEFSADMNSRAVGRIGEVRILRARQFTEDDGPLAHPVRPETYMEINNFFTATVYRKGAEVVRMIQTLIGRENFRKGMDLYIARHDNSAVTTEDFVQAMADASGIDLTRFQRWYGQAGTPVVTVSDHWDEAARRYELTVRQTTPPTAGQPVKEPLVIPLAMALLDPAGGEIETRLEGEAEAVAGTRVLTLSEAEQTFRFEDVAASPVPSLLRGFSAPVKLDGLSLDRLRFLARHDGDTFARWEAGQQVAAHALMTQVSAFRRGETLTLDDGLLDLVRHNLADADSDPAFAAETLILPDEEQLADRMPIVDVEAIHAARRFMLAGIGRALRPELEAAYARLGDDGPYRIDSRSIGRRALRNACLSYLAATESDAATALVKAQFDHARNMTDRLAALRLLAALDRPERTEALAKFLEDWRQEDLVVDKWLSIQASSPLPATLEHCRALLGHPVFDLKNPNRVRALVAAFAITNQLRFHDASGAGYAFLADQVIAIDPLNGQLAARLVQPLGTWRRQDQERQAAMKRELERVLAVTGLSKGTFEMASKSLA
ncbi:MAG TPA: aminopeptidase N [Aliidongia sp.]|nr:aminopeptidase N [Aliidongia sp.]